VDFVAAVQAAAPRVSWAWTWGIFLAPFVNSDGVARGKLDGEPSRSLWWTAGCSQFGFGCDFEAKLLSAF